MSAARGIIILFSVIAEICFEILQLRVCIVSTVICHSCLAYPAWPSSGRIAVEYRAAASDQLERPHTSAARSGCGIIGLYSLQDCGSGSVGLNGAITCKLGYF